MNFFRQLVLVETTITRPADTTAYAAGDIVGTTTDVGTSVSILTFTNAARANGIGGYVGSVIMIDSVNASTNIDADIFFFNTTLAQQADNVAFAPTDAEMNTCIGVVSIIGSDGKESSNNIAYNGIMPSSGKIDFVPDSGSRDIFAVIVVRNAYTPASGEILGSITTR